LVGGQADDVAGQSGGRRQAAASIQELECIHGRKTGAVIRVSLRLGALTARAGAEQLQALDEYGHLLGLAFQIADDLLDVCGHEATAGKRVGKDSRRGKLTFPGLLGVEASLAHAQRLIAEACELLPPLGSRAEGLEALARYVLERNR
jgi:geranylgeranyl diphosphate synthase type II